MEYIVCCIARNEEPYLDEWITHYLNLGFDHIIINDNNDDRNQLPNFLYDKPYKDSVIVIPWNGESNFQTKAYANVYDDYDFKWCAFYDCDEFLELTQHETIADYLSMFPDDCYTVSINWLCYGTNGNEKYSPEPLQLRFPYPHTPCDLSHENNRHIKVIARKVKLIKTIFLTPHFLSVPMKNAYINNGNRIPWSSFFTRSFNKPINYDYAYIKHYVTKSNEEFTKRNKNQRQNAKNMEKEERKRSRLLNELTDKPTEEILNDSKYLTDAIVPHQFILVRSTDLHTILGCLKEGKYVTLFGKDKSGKLLTRILNVAVHNRVKELSWIYDPQRINPEEYDIIID